MYIYPMMTLSKAFDAWETVVDLANDMGVPVQTAYGWRRRGSLPVKYWPRLIQKAKERGVTLTIEDLAASVAA